MGKRFGRNQKRRMRAEIAAAQRRLEDCAGEVARLKNELGEIVERVQEVQRYSSVLPAKTVRIGQEPQPGDSHYIANASRMDIFSKVEMGPRDIVDMGMAVPYVMARLEATQEVFKRMVRLRVTWGCAEAGFCYAVSPEAMRWNHEVVARDLREMLAARVPEVVQILSQKVLNP